MWDPNTWGREPHEFRIYGDNRAKLWAVVDEEDYHFFIKWLWNPKICRYGKIYLRRTHYFGEGRGGRQVTFYLHIEIMKRTGILQPSPLHNIVDHRNGHELDCRRRNLRWATPRMNGHKMIGKPNQLVLI